MRPRLAACLAGALALAAIPVPGLAQDTLAPAEGGLTTSLGQPPRRHWYAGGAFLADWLEPERLGLGTHALAGVSTDLTSPIVGVLAAALEGYAGVRVRELDGGARVLLYSPSLGLGGGVDWNVRTGRVSGIVNVMLPLRRGGIVGGGSMVRAGVLPGAQTVQAGITVPLRQPTAGRTRPKRSTVGIGVRPSARLSPPPDPPAALAEALADARSAAFRMQLLLVPPLETPGPDPTTALRPLIGRLRALPSLPGFVPGTDLQVDAVVRAYHEALQRAFTIAASDADLPAGAISPEGARVADSARSVLLEHVLYPYDRMLGQRREEPTLRSLSTFARGSFARVLVGSGLVPSERRDAVLYVFQELLDIVEAVRVAAQDEWRDPRLVWLPLQLGLRPEEHDTQAELDAIVERAVGRDFTDGNRVAYVINDQFQFQVDSSIRAARRYHVLWIHDFRGLNAEGRPDVMSLRTTVGSYLQALTDRVREYDSTGVLPLYMIFLDQHYYEVNRGRIWLDVLEHPLDSTHAPRLPRGSEDFAAALARALRELRTAVSGSRLLQEEARQYGARWLDNLVRVQINITNPVDPSFRARGVLPLIGMPDNLIRDHRKIVFYDVGEADPYEGMAIYTGMGIGEHYTGPTWEDRAIMVQGPATLSLKEQARQLLLGQGLRPEQIPWPLRPHPKGPDWDRRVAEEIAVQRAAAGDGHRAMELHNLTGFQEKPINVAKAVLYSLMPPGSVIKTPDSLWGSALYAALLTGSALRGVRVLIVAPSLAAAPSSGFPQMALAHDLLARLVVLQQELGPEIDAAGVMLKTGIYNPGIGVEAWADRFAAAYRNGRRTPFLRRLFPIDAVVDSLFTSMPSLAQMLQPAPEARRDSVTTPRDTVMPKLHLKANFFATREAWDSLVSRPEMVNVLMAYFAQLEPGAASGSLAAGQLDAATQALIGSFRRRLPPEQREHVAYFLIVGSANHDYRSMFLDGEASVLLAGWAGAVGLIDFGLLANLSVWIDDLEMLDALLPPPTGFKRTLTHWVRPLL